MEYKKIEELAEQGLSYGEIADITHETLADIVTYLEGLKISKTKPNPSREIQYKDRRSQIRSLHLDYGLSVEEIAKQMMVSKALVEEDLLFMGIIPSQRGHVASNSRQIQENESTKADEAHEEVEEISGEADEVPKIIAEYKGAEDSLQERRRKIAILYKAGISIDTIYKVFKTISSRIIDKDIEFIKEHEVNEDSMVLGTKSESSSKQSGQALIRNREAVAVRRQIVAILYGKVSVQQIATEVGVSEFIIKNDINFLTSKGVLQTQKELLEKRRNTVARLRGKIPISRIAVELDVTVGTINEDIRYLKEHGLIEASRLKRKTSRETLQQIESRRMQVAKLYGKMSQKDIAKELNVSPNTVYDDLVALREMGMIADESQQSKRIVVPSIEEVDRLHERRMEVAKLYGTMSYKQIAKLLGVSYGTVYNDVKYLISIGIISEEGVKRRNIARKDPKKEARLEQVAELYGKMTQKEIARELGVSIGTISSDIVELKQRGKIEASSKRINVLSTTKRKAIKDRRTQIADLYGTISTPEIAEKLGFSIPTIENDIRFLKTQGIIGQNDEIGRKTDDSQMNVVEAQTSTDVQNSTEAQTSTDVQNLSEAQSTTDEQEQVEYISNMVLQIKDYYKNGDIESAIKCLESIKDKIDFSAINFNAYQTLMRKLFSRKKIIQRKNELDKKLREDRSKESEAR